MIKGKTPEEIRKLFNIQNDFSPEEEAQIKKENVSHSLGFYTPCTPCAAVLHRFVTLTYLRSSTFRIRVNRTGMG